MGSSPFARHYSGSRGFFPFLRVLRCFSSPACLYLPYGFRQEYARITTRGFPHSEIPGSTDGQLLPEAYRSRPRPSSALGAKASTVCPYSLDSKEHVLLPLWSFQGARGPVPTRRLARADGLSKLNSVAPRSTLFQASADAGRPKGHQQQPRRRSPGGVRRRSGQTVLHACRSRSAPAFPRKEVIQPHLPVRLPCYDFTPIIDPTFDGCLLRRG